MIETEDIGYKRTKRGIKDNLPNELYRTNKNGDIIVNDGNLISVLDYMRNIKW